MIRYYNRQKNVPPCNHLDIGALRLPTLARNQAGDWLFGTFFFVRNSTDRVSFTSYM